MGPSMKSFLRAVGIIPLLFCILHFGLSYSQLPAFIVSSNQGLIFQNDLITTLVPQRAAGSYTPTFTRATTAYVADWENLFKPVLSGEARFTGARRVENKAPSNPTTWDTVTATITTGASDPDGGNNAFTVTNVSGQYCALTTPNYTSGTKVLNSIWIRRRTGTGFVYLYDGSDGNGETQITAVISSTWKRVSVGVKTAAGGGNNDIGIDIGVVCKCFLLFRLCMASYYTNVDFWYSGRS